MDGAPAADFRAVFRATPGLYLLLDPGFEIAEATETWLRQTDTVREQVLGRTLFDVLADNPNDPGAGGQRELRASLERVLQLRRADALPVTRYDIRRRDGGWEQRYWTLFNAPVLDGAGQVAWIVHRVRDVTELVRLRREGVERDELAREQQLLIDKLRAANEELANRERSLSESERRLAIALRAGRLGSWEMNLPDRAMVSSDLHKACFGRAPGDPFTHDDLRAAIYPDDRLHRQVALDASLHQGADYDVEYRTIWPDRSVHWVQIRGQVTLRWPDGSPRRMVGVSLDITDQKRIEERLEARVAARTRELAEANAQLTAAVAERDAAERALLQSQRLEAIGQLTGGVAHDFNNLLAAVIGNLEVLATKLADSSMLRHVDSALAAAWRGGRLTQQLLAYARQQRLVSTSVDVNALVLGMEGLLRHTLGGLVQVETALDQALWPASTDLTQLELVVLNLAINARDAMPNGGRLRIATRNVPAGDGMLPEELDPGDYVTITVTDDGVGMTPEILERACDPFFTTKEAGKGSGLGLSQAYGVARQSGGTVLLRSRPNEGTVVELLLPRASSPAVVEAPPAHTELFDRSPAVVLVVDDEPDIRAVTAELLSEAGHTVRKAATGPEALAELNARRFEVAVVDYAMPEMSGTEFAELARQAQPDLQVLFITGNPDALDRSGLGPRDQVLRKPYSQRELLLAVDRAVPANAV